MEDTSTCTSVCGDGYYLAHGNTQLAGILLRRRAVSV